MAAPRNLTGPERSLRAQLAADTRWSREDPNAPDSQIRKARAAILKAFERQVDPDGVLPQAERTRRALAARRAHMARMSLRSSKLRRARAAAAAKQAPGGAETGT